MRTSANHLHDALGAIATHRKVIGDTYERGSIVRTAENAREIFVLQQRRILFTDGHDTYRLSRHLIRFLDDLTQKQRLFEMLGSDIGKLNDRVHQLRDEYAEAFMDGRLDDIDHVAAEFHDACAELSDAVSSGISRLLLQAENNFAAVRALSAKERQNLHYLDQSDKLSQALGSLERMNMQDLLDMDTPRYAGLAIPYRRLVTNRLAEWNTELGRVTSILKAYLYRLRLIAPDVKRLRAFARFLHQNPGYAPPDYENRRNVPAWLLRDQGQKLTAYPNVEDRALLPELDAIARNLPAPRVSVRVPREAGSLSRRAGEQQPIEVVQPPHRIALQRLGHDALRATGPLSALEWKREHAADLGVPDDVWLLLVLHSRDIDTLPFRRLAYDAVSHRGDSPMSRNVYIQDVLLHGR